MCVLRTYCVKRWRRRWFGVLTGRHLATRSVTSWNGPRTFWKTSTISARFCRVPSPRSSPSSGQYVHSTSSPCCCVHPLRQTVDLQAPHLTDWLLLPQFYAQELLEDVSLFAWGIDAAATIVKAASCWRVTFDISKHWHVTAAIVSEIIGRAAALGAGFD